MTRDEYVVSGIPPEVSRTFWDVALDYLRPQLHLATVDMFPDLSDGWQRRVPFSEGEKAAYDLLRQVAKAPDSRRRRTWMAEELDLTDAATFEAYKTYGYHSIETSAYRRDEPEASPALHNHDSGSSIMVRLTERELEGLRERLEGPGWPRDELKRWEPEGKRRWLRRD